MIAKDLINPIVPALSVDDDIARASSLMEDLQVAALPVLEDAVFRGFIREEALYDDMYDKANVGAYPLITNGCTVYQGQHFYEILKTAAGCEYNMMAVLEEDDVFVGVITPEDLMQAFAQSIAVQSAGSIIVVTLRQIDYSLAEITRLIESENVKVLGSFLLNNPEDATQLDLTLKLDKKNVSHVVATLKRFDYKVSQIFQEEKLISYEKERLDALLKYLSI
ncbi:MAG: CBS domain-containing protein [Cyclobacteriaceae bacterium]